MNEEQYKCSLIVAKNRLAPKRIKSIVQLELCGCLIASRMRKKIEEEIK